MAIAFDAASGNFINPDTSLTVSHTCTGSDRALVVAVTDISDTASLITGVTYNSVALTKVDEIRHSAGGRWFTLWILIAPATGANNIVVSASGSTYIGLAAASYTGVDQTGQPEVEFEAESSDGTAELGLTTLTDDSWIVAGAKAETGDTAAGTGATRRATDLLTSPNGITAIFDSNGSTGTAGAKTINVTGNTFLAGISIALAPAVVTDTLTVSSPAQYQTFQRSGSTGSISISGTYTGTPTAIEASFNGGAYSTIDASPAGGTFSGTLSSQSQGQGTLTVRFTNDTAVNDTVADVGIGDVFLLIGDSITDGRATNPQSYAHATLKGTAFNQSDAWINGNDPIDIHATDGSHWPLLATHIMEDQGVPVAFITVGTGSTDIAGTNDQWAQGNSSYLELQDQAADSGVSFKAVLAHFGPNAVSSSLSQATYNAALDALIAAIRTDIQADLKLCVGIFGEVTTVSGLRDTLRGAIIEAWGDNANILPGPNLIDSNYTDGVHPQSDAEVQQVADRWWAALDQDFYGGSSARGPQLVSAIENGARTEITVKFNQTLKTGLTFTEAAWVVEDDGTPVGVASIAYHGSDVTALVITLDAALTGVGTITFASESTSIGAVVPLGPNFALPDASTINLPAEPFFDEVTSRTLSADSGSYSLTGTDASLEQGYEIAADSGSFSITGTDASLEQGYAINPEEGSYIVSGVDASLIAGNNYEILVDPGSYSLTGTDADFTEGFGLTADVGSYLVTGVSASLLQHSILNAAVGSYLVTGVPATLSENLENIVGGRFIVGQVYYPGFKQAQVNN